MKLFNVYFLKKVVLFKTTIKYHELIIFIFCLNTFLLAPKFFFFFFFEVYDIVKLVLIFVHGR